MNKKAFYLRLILGSALVAVSLILIFFSDDSSERRQTAPAKDAKKIVPFALSEDRSFFEEMVYQGIDQSVGAVEEKTEQREKAREFFARLERAESEISKESFNVPAPVSESEDRDVLERALPQTITIEAKLANRIFPDYYLSYLRSLDSLFKKERFVPPDRIVPLDTVGDVFAFTRESLEYFLKSGTISEGEYSNFFRGFTVIWPKTLEMEFGGAVSAQTEPSTPWTLQPLVSSRKIFPIAQAQALCFRSGAGSEGVGSNLAAPCCNCRVMGYPVGCLNAVCTNGPAIFDQQTGICGCGLSSGAGAM